MDEGLAPLHLQQNLLAAEEQNFGLVNQNAATLATVSGVQNPAQSAASEINSLGFLDGALPARRRIIRTSRSLEVSHASPLAPLRARDRQALDDLFDADNLQEVTLDIHRYLARVYPEPCWEDEPYDFLHGYI